MATCSSATLARVEREHMNSGLLSHNNRIVFLGMATVIAIIISIAHATPGEEVSAALIRVTSGDDGLRAGLDELRHLPREYVVPAVVEYLREHPTQENERVGVALYAVLEFHNAASHEIGYVQLMAGLQSKATRGICAMALAKTPPPQSKDVVERFSTLLVDTALDSSDKEKL